MLGGLDALVATVTAGERRRGRGGVMVVSEGLRDGLAAGAQGGVHLVGGELVAELLVLIWDRRRGRRRRRIRLGRGSVWGGGPGG